MGFFSKLFGGGAPTANVPAPEPEAALYPDAVVVLRRGMNLPNAEYVAKVVASAFPQGLPESVPRVGLSQPSWFKNEEGADSIATGVVETFAPKYDLGAAGSRRRALEGPDGCAVMLVEIYRG